jgi:beta-lactamase regulating signal transducer with metallopeptidase domain
MESILLYFIKSGALIVMFLAAYSFFLRKETFFKSNRWFLLFGLVISVLLPVVTFKKTIWVEPIPIVQNMQDLASDASLAKAYNLKNAATEAIVTSWVEKSFEIDRFCVIAAIYAIGILALLVKFALDFYALKKVLKGKKIHQQEDYKFVNVEENIAPFSYFNYIVYNPALYNQVELENILEHEKVHCSQNHTIDVLIARVFCIAFWWNPFVWFYKKAIVQNLEFIADNDAFKNISDKRGYQFTLLKITTHESCVTISNHFYQSLIKKRIVMLNKNQSNRWNSWKYAIIVPALALFMWQFQTKVVAQEKKSTIVSHSSSTTIRKEVTAKSTDAELKELERFFKEQHDAILKFSKVQRNKAGEIISLKAVMESKGTNDNKGVYRVSGNIPIKAFIIIKYNDSKGMQFITFGESDKVVVTPSGTNSDTTNVVSEAAEVDDIAYAFYDTNDEITPPTPPMPPTVPNYPVPPAVPTFPTIPTAPTTPPAENNKRAWKKFEEDIKKFETKMNSVKMKKWEKEMEDYGKKMDVINPDTEVFDKDMKVFDEKMQTFNAEMRVFEKKMQEYSRQIQQEVRNEILEERNEALKVRKEMLEERNEALKDREEARKNRSQKGNK